MPDAISNPSPLLYLHRIGVLVWLPELFGEVWIPNAVVGELKEGGSAGGTMSQIRIFVLGSTSLSRAMSHLSG